MECTHDILSSFQVVESAKRTKGLLVPYVDVAPEIRERILSHMTQFLESPDSRGAILLYGYAGCGKSTLLQSIVEEIEKDRVNIFTVFTTNIVEGEIYVIRDYGADAKTRDLRPMFEGIQHALVVMGINYGEEDKAKHKISELNLEIKEEFPYGEEVARKLLDVKHFADIIKVHKFAYYCDQCVKECRYRDFYRLAFEDIDREIEGEKNVLNRLYFLYLYSFASRKDVTDRLTPRYIIKWMIESAAFRDKIHLIPSVDSSWSESTTEDDFLNPNKTFNSLFIGGLAFKAFVRYLVKGISGPIRTEFENLFLNGIKHYILIKFGLTGRIETETISNELLIGAFSDRMTTYVDRNYPVFYLEKRNLSFYIDHELMEIYAKYQFDVEDIVFLRLPYEIFRYLYELAQGTIVLSFEKYEEFLRKFLDDCLYRYSKQHGFDNTQHLLISTAISISELLELQMATINSTKTKTLESSDKSVVLYIGKSFGIEYEPYEIEIIEFRGSHHSRGWRGGTIPRKSTQPESSRFRAFVSSAYAYLGYKVDLTRSGARVDWLTEQIVEEGRTGIILPNREEVEAVGLTPEELAVVIGFQRMFNIHKETQWNRYLIVPSSLSDFPWSEDRNLITSASRDHYLNFLNDIGFLNKINRFETIRLSPLFLSATVKFFCCKLNIGKLQFNEYKERIWSHFCVKNIDDDDLKKRLEWLGMYEKRPDGAEIVKLEEN